jgi:hypothetical protein
MNDRMKKIDDPMRFYSLLAKKSGHYDAKAEFALLKLCRNVSQFSQFEVLDAIHDI